MANLRLNGTWDVDRRLPSHHAELLLTVFDHVEFDRDDAGNFNGAAEGYFTIALCLWSASGHRNAIGLAHARSASRQLKTSPL